MSRISWGQELLRVIKANGEDLGTLNTTLSDEEMAREFEGGYGRVEGVPFTAWTENFVYFPLSYDGCEWVGSAPRNPNGVKLKHQGGGW